MQRAPPVGAGREASDYRIAANGVLLLCMARPGRRAGSRTRRAPERSAVATSPSVRKRKQLGEANPRGTMPAGSSSWRTTSHGRPDQNEESGDSVRECRGEQQRPRTDPSRPSRSHVASTRRRSSNAHSGSSASRITPHHSGPERAPNPPGPEGGQCSGARGRRTDQMDRSGSVATVEAVCVGRDDAKSRPRAVVGGRTLEKTGLDEPLKFTVVAGDRERRAPTAAELTLAASAASAASPL